MERKSVKHLARNSFYGLKVDDVVVLMELLDMSEYCELVRDKLLDGDKLLSLTEGKATLWRSKVNIKNLMRAIEDMKANPEKYIEIICNSRNSRNSSFEAKGKSREHNSISVAREERKTCSDTGKSFGIENSLNLHMKNAYDTSMNKFVQNKETLSSKEFIMINVNPQRDTRHDDSVDMFIRSFKPERTFLYSLKNRHSPIHSPYLPMDMNIQKDPGKEVFETIFDSDFSKRFNYKNDKMNLFPYEDQDEDYCLPGRSEDRGYYVFNLKRGSASELYNKYRFPNATQKPTRKSMSNLPKHSDDNENSITEHFYEDLNDNKNYYETEPGDSQMNKRFQFYPLSKSACMLRVSEIVSILSCPKQCKFKYNLRKGAKSKKEMGLPDLEKPNTKENYETTTPESHKQLNYVYGENSAIYDVISPKTSDSNRTNNESNDGSTRLEVEDYLEPIRLTRDYSDVVYEPQDQSIVTALMKMFENNFKLKKDQPNRKSQPIDHGGYLSPPPKPIPVDKKRLQEIARRGTLEGCPKGRGGMADRPLPVPVESEFYYMQVDRERAQELLEGHADGTFILRPSSQGGYLYSMSLVYQQRVFNLGVRRRADNRLALGFSKSSEQSFQTIKELIEYHYKEKLVLIVKGEKVGSVLLKKLHG